MHGWMDGYIDRQMVTYPLIKAVYHMYIHRLIESGSYEIYCACLGISDLSTIPSHDRVFRLAAIRLQRHRFRLDPAQ